MARRPLTAIAPRFIRALAKRPTSLALALLATACATEHATAPAIPSGNPAAFRWQLPAGFPAPLVPADNAIKATIQDGDKKSELLMKAEGDKAVAPLAAPLGKGAIVVLTGKISGGHGMTARFTAK